MGDFVNQLLIVSILLCNLLCSFLLSTTAVAQQKVPTKNYGPKGPTLQEQQKLLRDEVDRLETFLIKEEAESNRLACRKTLYDTKGEVKRIPNDKPGQMRWTRCTEVVSKQQTDKQLLESHKKMLCEVVTKLNPGKQIDCVNTFKPIVKQPVPQSTPSAGANPQVDDAAGAPKKDQPAVNEEKSQSVPPPEAKSLNEETPP